MIKMFYDFAGVVYAFIFGQVNNIISQLSQTSNEYLSQLRAIRLFNIIYKIPNKVRTRAENYFIATWSVTRGTDEENVKLMICLARKKYRFFEFA